MQPLLWCLHAVPAVPTVNVGSAIPVVPAMVSALPVCTSKPEGDRSICRGYFAGSSGTHLTPPDQYRAPCRAMSALLTTFMACADMSTASDTAFLVQGKHREGH